MRWAGKAFFWGWGVGVEMTWLSFSLILATGYARKLQSPTDCHAPDFVFLKLPCALWTCSCSTFRGGGKGNVSFKEENVEKGNGTFSR